MTTKNKIIKLISALLIISIITPAVLFSKPKQVEASSVPVGVPVNDFIAQGFLEVVAAETTVDTTKTLAKWAVYIGEQLLKLAAKQLLRKMTQATINWINSDFHGSPLFLENPQSFFGDIAKSELRAMVDEFGYDDLLYPFGRQFALNAIASYKRQFRDNAQYTLSKVIRNQDELRLFREDFDYGGWNGFLINTQYPQNNYLGFQILMNDELANRIEGTAQAPAKKYQDLLQQGLGFLSPQMCKSNPKYNNGVNEFRKPSFQYPPFDEKTIDDKSCTTDDCRQEAENKAFKEYNDARDIERADWAVKNTCPGGLENTTPGYVAANQVSQALDSPRMMTLLDGALGNSVAAIFDALINHFFEKGLNKLADFVNPQPSFNDNWSYDDYRLDDDIDVGGGFDIPKDISVSVRVGEETSTLIPAGDYSIQSQSDESVATAEIDVTSSSGNKLIVKGIAVIKDSVTGEIKNTNIVTIKYSSYPVQTFLLTITVGEIGGLLVSPASIVTNDINTPIIATISGGNGDYSLIKGPDEAIAIATIAGVNLIVTGINNGETQVEIKDSSGKTFTVNIRIGPDDLIITPANIQVNVGEETSIPVISNGVAPYIVRNQENTNVATAEILPDSPDRLTITGISSGTSTVTIEDKSNPAKTAEITITTVDNNNNTPSDYNNPVYTP